MLSAAFSFMPLTADNSSMRGFLNLIHRTEMFQEGFSACGTNAGDGIQLRCHALLGAPCAMGCDPVAMRLVADSLHKIKSLRMTRQDQRLAVVREENFLFLFGKPNHGHFVEQVKLLEDFDHASQLTFTAVDNDQVGEEGKRCIRFGPWGWILFPVSLSTFGICA